ncbi:MAG: 3-dehydroquinate synthase [Ruminococcus sp.]|nr:3-dehydroquinate synthase [Candidatus Apopatosoma intestinale]
MKQLQKARKAIDRADTRMAGLFCRRMKTVETIAAYKRENGLPVLDPAREQAMLSGSVTRVPADLSSEYRSFLRHTLSVSRSHQNRMADAATHPDSFLPVFTDNGYYPIFLERGLLGRADAFLSLSRRVLIVTDDGVPDDYVKVFASLCAAPTVVTLPHGESSKSVENWMALSRTMLEHSFTRADCVVALGGGMVGDLAGFAASTFMRGIDFYNIPTTLLAQVDSSIGGKTAVDFGGIKNPVGSFYPPKAVLIDPDLLDTLSPKLFSEGMAEVIKMAVTFDRAFFERLEALILSDRVKDDLPEIIRSALLIKKEVVEQDEHEAHLRRALNFGHTVGHAVEAGTDLLHGECVALGMLVFSAPAVRARLVPLYEKLGLPRTVSLAAAAFAEALPHDKKAGKDKITVIVCDGIGSFAMKDLSPMEILKKAASTFAGKESV